MLIAAAAVLLPVLIVSSFAGMGRRTASLAQAESSVVTVHPHEERIENADSAGRTTVFLAGTIDMGNSVDWQARADSLFAALPSPPAASCCSTRVRNTGTQPNPERWTIR